MYHLHVIFLNAKLTHYMEALCKSLKICGFFSFQDGVLVLLRLKTAGAYLHTS